MCIAQAPKVPDYEPVDPPKPPPVAPPPEKSAEAPVINEGPARTGSKRDSSQKRARGTAALRIRLNVAQPTTGVNVPGGS